MHYIHAQPPTGKTEIIIYCDLASRNSQVILMHLMHSTNGRVFYLLFS